MIKQQASSHQSHKKLSIVIPALNEEEGIGRVLDAIPIKELRAMNYEVELMVIDNGSTDQTPHIARRHGATVIIQPVRGYGNAYKAGFANATGDIIATGDADLTYPFEILPAVLTRMKAEQLDFVTTNRLNSLTPGVMSLSHQFGNAVLSTMTFVLYKLPFHDSQSGMWVFKRSLWPQLDVRSSGMPFSQELKIEAFFKGFKCAEFPITYQARAGKEKLNYGDAFDNVFHLLKKRFTVRREPMTITSSESSEAEHQVELS